jgi:hypothetical protein
MATAADHARDDPGFVLVGGHPSLNLVATLGRRHATPVERIQDAAALWPTARSEVEGSVRRAFTGTSSVQLTELLTRPRIVATTH